MAHHGRRAGTQSKVLINGIFEQRLAKDRGVSVGSIDVHLIGGSPSTLDWGIDFVETINQVASNLNSVLPRDDLLWSVISHEQIAVADLKSTVIAEDVAPDRDTVNIRGIQV